jgi:hypothetical protein
MADGHRLRCRYLGAERRRHLCLHPGAHVGGNHGAWHRGELATYWKIAAQGLIGLTGETGAALLTGSGVPSSGTGSNGDCYVDLATGNFYGPKAGGAWGSAVFCLIGVNGTDGQDGAVGAAGSQMLATTGVPLNTLGVDGDWARDGDACIEYGPKAGGVWPTGKSYKGQAGGTMAWYGLYSASINYPINAGVSFSTGGVISSYICIQVNGPLTTIADPSNANYWQVTSQGGNAAAVYDETPAGPLNGVNQTFTLQYAPATGSLRLTLNGMKFEGGGIDYTLTTATIVFVSSWASALTSDAVIRADYTH